MKPFVFLLLLGLFVASSGFCQQNPVPVFAAKKMAARNDRFLKQSFTSYQTMQFTGSALAAFVKNKNSCTLNLKLSEELDITLTLEPSTMVLPGYTLQIQTAEGVKHIASKPDFLFKGKLEGASGETRLTIKEDFFYGYITSDQHTYFIEPLKPYDTTAGKEEFVMYKASDVKEGSLACGVKEVQNIARQTRRQRKADSLSTQSSVCGRINFVSFADYSIYQKFKANIADIETAFLSNLNMAESAFQTLNLQNTGTDVGPDGLQFAMDKIVIATCQPCDIPRASNYVNDITTDVSEWIIKNPTAGARMYQFYTTRDLYAAGQAIVGYASGSILQVLKYHTDNPATLRLMVAHETGHNLGCQHDNQVKGTVTNRIMYSGAGPDHTTFSTLEDFEGIPYSSHKVMNEFLLRPPPALQLLTPCQPPTCPKVEDLKITQTTEQVQVSWKGTGNFRITYKIRDSISPVHDSSLIINGNSITLQNLVPCTIYSLTVQQVCATNEYGNHSTLEFTTSPVSVVAKPVNLRNDLYDLQLDIDCMNCPSTDYTIKIDNRTSLHYLKNGRHQLVIKDLFADGAKHKVSVQKDTTYGACKAQYAYSAPYYRASSKELLGANFNSCTKPTDWKDSILVSSSNNPYWFIGSRNFFQYNYTTSGTLDSSCMIYYSNFLGYRGTLALTSPSIDLTNYKNIFLHFDYNFVSYILPNRQNPGSLTVQVYDAAQWQTVMTVSSNERLVPGRPLRDTWDTLPSRRFISLDAYKNPYFKVRFIVDDGSLAGAPSSWLFAALDNIRLDGYPMTDSPENEFTLFPNPATSDLFVQVKNPSTTLTYRLVDMLGREVVKESILNNRISVNTLSSGIYVVQLFDNNKLIGTKKFIKH